MFGSCIQITLYSKEPYSGNEKCENVFLFQFSQAHRKVLGLLAFGQSEKSGDLPELYSSYDDIKQQFKYVALSL